MRDRHDDPSAQDPLPGLSGVGRTKPSDGSTAVDAAKQATEVDAAAEVGATGAATEIGAVGAVAADPISAVTNALATGAIDADAARSQLIDAVIAAQMPPGADPAVWQSIRAEVEALLVGDPTLADLLRA